MYLRAFRARTSCPLCSTDEEIWFLEGKVQPLDLVECTKCSNIYEADQFVSSFLNTYQNLTISSNHSIMTSTI